MSVEVRPAKAKAFVYPESDGKPMANNTLQFDWITIIKGGLDAFFRDDPNVFVAGDLLWYPLREDDKTRVAPDAMVVFGRPKGPRGAYAQALEGNIAPQVVFEILSPGNRKTEMKLKFEFYQRFGVEEYYVYDTHRGTLEGWLRQAGQLQPINPMQGWVSPRLQIRFGLSGKNLELYTPSGELFVSYVEVYKQALEARKRAEQEWFRAEQEHYRAEQEQLKAEQESQRAEQERLKADKEQLRAEQESQRAEQERKAKEAAWAKLRELGVDPENL